jgi:hypothetical protein
MDSEGIQNGCTRKVLIRTAMARAVRSRPGSSAQNERFFFCFSPLVAEGTSSGLSSGRVESPASGW